MSEIFVRYFDGDDKLITSDIINIPTHESEENENVERFLRKRMSEFYQVKFCLYSWHVGCSRCCRYVGNPNFRGNPVESN